METKKEKSGGCCSCGSEFKKNIENLENEAQKPKKSEHDKKQGELDSAFEEKKKK